MTTTAHRQQPFENFEKAFNPTHRHVKSGGDYEVLGVGHVQCNVPLSDMAEVVIYQGEDGRLWARAKDEFFDGRFEEK